MSNDTKHTKEPWYYDKDGDAISPEHNRSVEVCSISSMDLRDNGRYCSGAITDANARRIVACVNACAGLDNYELEVLAHGTAKDEIELANNLIAEKQQRITDLERQLADAKFLADKRLEDLIECRKWYDEETINKGNCRAELNEIRNQLAEAKGRNTELRRYTSHVDGCKHGEWVANYDHAVPHLGSCTCGLDKATGGGT